MSPGGDRVCSHRVAPRDPLPDPPGIISSRHDSKPIVSLTLLTRAPRPPVLSTGRQ